MSEYRSFILYELPFVFWRVFFFFFFLVKLFERAYLKLNRRAIGEFQQKKIVLYFRSLKSHYWNPRMQPALPSSYEIRPSDATLKIIWEFSWRTFTDD